MKRLKLVMIPMLALMLCGNLLGQEDDEPIVESTHMEMTVIGSDDDGPPMIFSSSNGSGVMAFSAAGSPMGIGGMGEFNMPAPNPWSLVNNPSVQKDLELVGDQLDRVKDLQREHSKELKKHLGDMKNGSIDLSNIKNLKDSMEKLRERQREELKKLLLPHQVERLQQIALQTHMKQAGTANALANKKVVEALGMTDKQVDRLKEKSKELKKKLAAEIQKLQDKMKAELLQELTPEQRQKLESMTGDQYTPKNEDWRERFNSIRRSGARGEKSRSIRRIRSGDQ